MKAYFRRRKVPTITLAASESEETVASLNALKDGNTYIRVGDPEPAAVTGDETPTDTVADVTDATPVETVEAPVTTDAPKTITGPPPSFLQIPVEDVAKVEAEADTEINKVGSDITSIVPGSASTVGKSTDDLVKEIHAAVTDMQAKYEFLVTAVTNAGKQLADHPILGKIFGGLGL